MSASTPPVSAPAAKRRTGRGRFPLILAVLAVLSVAAVAWFFTRTQSEPIDPALIVTAERARLTVEVVDVGRIEAIEQVEIASRVPGVVRSVHVEEGDTVKPGQLLVRLDPRDAARRGARARAELSKAKARLAHAQSEVKRRSRGVEQGIVSQVDLRSVQRESELARADLALARVFVTEARDLAKDTRLSAPISGTVTRRSIEPGEMVKPGVESSFESVSLLTICDLSRMLVKVQLNQIDVAKIRVGQRVRLRLDALPQEQFVARVTRIAAASVKIPGKDLESFPVEALLERTDPRIKPGMTADVHIAVSEKKDALLLPLESVRRDGAKAFVMRVVSDPAGERTEEVLVTLGDENDHQVEVLEGLEAGARVKIDPPSAASNETKI